MVLFRSLIPTNQGTLVIKVPAVSALRQSLVSRVRQVTTCETLVI